MTKTFTQQMSIKAPQPDFDPSLQLRIDPKGTWLNLDQEPLILSPKGWPLLPVIDGEPVRLNYTDTSPYAGGVSHRFESADADSDLGMFQLRVVSNTGYIDISCEFTVTHDCQLNALQVFPAETGLNLYDVVNFRNRHFTASTWPELIIGRSFSTTTYSDDWQFAPHPTAILLRKNEYSLFMGATGLQASFGMRMEVERGKVLNWDIDFGSSPHGLMLKAGQSFSSEPLRIFLQKDRTPYESFADFGRSLIADGRILDPAAKSRPSWWRSPLYCTWGDQWMGSHKAPAVSLADQTAESASQASAQLTEGMVRKAVACIEREKLPIRTILLDEGWAHARGEWTPNRERFPDLRKLVDELHEKGYKVMLWWTWADTANNANIDPSELVDRGEWRNRHGIRWRDYSDPAVQENYLKPLLRFFFSAEPDCLDIDGIKTDFIADKIHPETPLANPEWRGEERYFQKITELIYTEMRRHKPDAMHMGCAGNYWLADYFDTNRTFDVHSSNWLEHENRARMIMATSPGAIPSLT